MKLLQTPLYQECKELGGKMVPFANWEMPVSFSGLIEEHNAVRKNVGMFDISHMGVVQLKGKNIKSALQNLVPVSYTHLRAHETKANLVCRLLLEKKK